MRVTIKFYPNQRKRNSKTNKVPIYVRLLDLTNRKKAESRLDSDYDLTEKELNLWNPILGRVDIREHPTNEYLEIIHNRFRNLKNEYLKTDNSWDIKLLLKKTISNEKCKKPETLIAFVNKFLKKKILDDSTRKEGTKKNYEIAIEHFRLFLKYKKIEEISIENFNFDFAEEFKSFLECKIETLPEKKKNTKVTSSSKIKKIRPIFRYAIELGIIKKNPFDKIKLTQKDKTTQCLTVYQVMSIKNIDYSKFNKDDEIARDLFLFMCFTGLHFGDMMMLTSSSFQKSNEAEYILNIQTEKSGQFVKQVITKEAQLIITKYNPQFPLIFRKNIFPCETLESINRKLKNVAKSANINLTLSTKIGRTTFREILYASGIKDEVMVSCYMGWSNNKKIDNYYFNRNEAKMKNVTDEINEYLENSL